MAVDRGNPPRSGSITFTVDLVDVNEFAPAFQNPPFVYTALAHYAPGTFLGRNLFFRTMDLVQNSKLDPIYNCTLGSSRYDFLCYNQPVYSSHLYITDVLTGPSGGGFNSFHCFKFVLLLGTVFAIDNDGTTRNEDIIYTVMDIPNEFSYTITAASGVQLSTNVSFSASTSVIIF